MSCACILEYAVAHLATMELTVKHVVPLSFGPQIVARCASVIHTAVATLSQVSAPATQTAGVLFASTRANAPAMASVTPSMVTAPAMKAGRHKPVLNHASV